MSIDWVTVVAQIVNFLILVWLLRRFLFGPVSRAMARREQHISDRIAEAQKARAEAEAQAKVYQEQQAELQRQSQALLTTARASADEAKQKLLLEARAQADGRRREWLGQIEAQQDEFLQGLRQRVADEYLALARQMLREMADADLEARMTDAFVRNLDGVEAGARQKLVTAAAESGSVTVASRFALAEAQRRQLTERVHELVGGDAEVTYEDGPSGPFGIELRAGSQTVQWTFDEYLNRLEKSLTQMLAERLPSTPAPVATEAPSS